MIGRARSIPAAVAAVVLAVVVVSCGGSDGEAPEGLSPSALTGWELARSNGCVACHGADGSGATGPPWVGLAGSVRPLADGSEVVADRAYLSRAIADPQFEQVSGYNILMPQVPLTEPEMSSIVDYIVELS